MLFIQFISSSVPESSDSTLNAGFPKLATVASLCLVLPVITEELQ